jgi:hypothetical protein
MLILLAEERRLGVQHLQHAQYPRRRRKSSPPLRLKPVMVGTKALELTLTLEGLHVAALVRAQVERDQ